MRPCNVWTSHLLDSLPPEGDQRIGMEPDGSSGRVHAIETLGALDGPGLRTVVFLQGCHLRCAFCHNPETWRLDGGQVFTVDALFDRIRRNIPYFGKTGNRLDQGGITLSGGEPLLQAKFIAPLLKHCKDAGISTAIDTAGVPVDDDVVQVLELTDLVILDIKASDDAGYRKVAGAPMKWTMEFMKTAAQRGCRIWVRHVVVPGTNDSEKDMEALANLLISTGIHFEKVELLPYHRLGVAKYEISGIPYVLTHVPELDRKSLALLQSTLDGAMAKADIARGFLDQRLE